MKIKGRAAQRKGEGPPVAFEDYTPLDTSLVAAARARYRSTDNLAQGGSRGSEPPTLRKAASLRRRAVASDHGSRLPLSISGARAQMRPGRSTLNILNTLKGERYRPRAVRDLRVNCQMGRDAAHRLTSKGRVPLTFLFSERSLRPRFNRQAAVPCTPTTRKKLDRHDPVNFDRQAASHLTETCIDLGRERCVTR